jgi:hypothetical protein
MVITATFWGSATFDESILRRLTAHISGRELKIWEFFEGFPKKVDLRRVLTTSLGHELRPYPIYWLGVFSYEGSRSCRVINIIIARIFFQEFIFKRDQKGGKINSKRDVLPSRQ